MRPIQPEASSIQLEGPSIHKKARTDKEKAWLIPQKGP
jgi:hypothetical protein